MNWWWALPLGVGAGATPVIAWLRRRMRVEAEAVSAAAAGLADLRARLASERPGRPSAELGRAVRQRHPR